MSRNPHPDSVSATNVRRLLFLLIAAGVCLIVFGGTAYTVATQESPELPLPRISARTPTLALSQPLTLTPTSATPALPTDTPQLTLSQPLTATGTSTVLPSTPTPAATPFGPTPTPTAVPFATEPAVVETTLTPVIPGSTFTPTADFVSTATPTPILTTTATATDTLDSYATISMTVIIRLRAAVPMERLSEFSAGNNGLIMRRIPALRAAIMELPLKTVQQLVQSLQDYPDFESVSQDAPVNAMFIPNDPRWLEQPYMAAMQIPAAWEVTTGAYVVVAVLDSGISSNHPELSDRLWVNMGETGVDANGNDRRDNGIDDDGDGYIDDWRGWNMAAASNAIVDDNGHGTMVAGVIAASGNNGSGMAGISWGARLMPVKVIDSAGNGTQSGLAEGIVYAVDHGARVINISLGGATSTPLLNAAVDYAESRSVVIVAAAGNDPTRVTYPAAYPNVIAVGATSADNSLAPFSGTGPEIRLVAPGVTILSTSRDGGYATGSGTSLAAANVSGVAALLAGEAPASSPADIRGALYASALDLGSSGFDNAYGYGLVQAFYALSPTGYLLVTPATPTFALHAPLARILAVATPTAPAMAPTSVPSANDPHVRYDYTTSSCAGCHRPHTSEGTDLRAASTEESVCFACHTNTASPYAGKNVQPAFTTVTNTATGIYKHNGAATLNIHQAGESTSGQYGGSNRHVECEDCHEPHEATRGVARAPFIQRVMNTVSGVDVSWSAAGLPNGYTAMTSAEREYQVCFKCHSSFTTLPTYQPDGWNGTVTVTNGLHKLTSALPRQVLDSRDMAQEFNPYNASFHPVTAMGTNQSIPAGSWRTGTGITQTSIIYCSSCHNNPSSISSGVGPHGSPMLHILTGTVNYKTVDTNSGTVSSLDVCFACHAYATYVSGGASSTNFLSSPNGDNLHSKHMTDYRATCYTCHDTHGSEQLHLMNFDAAIAAPSTGVNSQSAWTAMITVTNGITRTIGGGCAVSCHGETHTPANHPYRFTQ